jgi:formylglycine-generating enzyme required for sulfatase activity
MATIPAGTFLMGSPGSEPGRQEDEVQHPVTVSSFRLMKTEVTQAMFESVMGFNPAAVGSTSWGTACREYEGVPLVDPSFPVMCVTWLDGVEFANALSRKEGVPPAYVINNGVVARVAGSTGYRFPTEAEWEYAARAGTTTPYATVSSSDLAVCGAANVGDATAKAKWTTWTTFGCSDGVLGLARVGSFAANAWGLHDMIGNVWEWVEDWYAAYPPGSLTDPAGPSGGSNRVYRGGGWYGAPAYARVANRDGNAPGDRDCNLGFRLARSNP